MTKSFKIFLAALIIGCAPMVWACDADDDWSTTPNGSFKDDVSKKIYGDYTPSETMTNLTDDIRGILTVDSSKSKGGDGSGKEYEYLNNEDSATENRNKMRLNAASQAISLGQHAVSAATTSGEDVDALRKEIENRDDMLRMLKGIAKLQAQDLQKTNAITAMRAKLTELSALDNIISGSIYTTKKSTSKSSSSK